MITMSCSVDDHNLRIELKQLHELAGPSATASALNRTRTKVLRSAYKDIAAAKGMAVSRVSGRYDRYGKRKGPRIRYTRAKRKVLATGWDWLPKRRPGKVALIQVSNVKQNAFGVSTKTLSIKSAFITSARSHRSFAVKTRTRKGKKVKVEVAVDNKQVYLRRGKTPYPIDVQRLDLNPEADQIMVAAVANAGPIWRREVRKSIAKELRKIRAKRFI